MKFFCDDRILISEIEAAGHELSRLESQFNAMALTYTNGLVRVWSDTRAGIALSWRDALAEVMPKVALFDDAELGERLYNRGFTVVCFNSIDLGSEVLELIVNLADVAVFITRESKVDTGNRLYHSPDVPIEVLESSIMKTRRQ